MVHGSKTATCADQQRLGRIDSAAEVSRNFGHRETVEVAQREYRSVVRSEYGHHLVDHLTVENDVPDVINISGEVMRGVVAERLGTGSTICASPLVEQLVARDADQPGHGHLVDTTLVDLADRGEERVSREVLGHCAVGTSSAQVRVDLADRAVVDRQQRRAVIDRLTPHHPHHRSPTPNSDTPISLTVHVTLQMVRSIRSATRTGRPDNSRGDFGRSTVHFGRDSGSVEDVSSQPVDIAVIGAGPAGAATAIQAARSGAKVVVFEKGAHGRDKVCGDGLTPRAVGALNELKIPLDDAHHIRGLRMIAGKQVRELDWPTTDRFPNHGAVWPRRRLDAALMDAAVEAGAEIIFETEATPVIDDNGRVTGVEANGNRFDAGLTVIAAGAQGAVARKLGADRVPDEPFGLAIRTYAATPRHTDVHLEACLSLKDEHGTAIPGYGWMFPAGDGTVNIGVGALSTMKGFKKLNLNTLLEAYRNLVQDDWDLGPNLERPRAWRLPMSTQRRHGDGWVASRRRRRFRQPHER